MAYCGPKGIALEEFLRWSKASQDAALAWQAHENRRCKSCGTHPDEWADDKLAYHAHLSECQGCKQRERRSDTEEAKTGEGRYVVMAGGPASECPGCRPLRLV